MERRTLLLAPLLLLLGSRPAAAQTASGVRRVGVLASSTKESFGDNIRTFREELAALGWAEGRNLAIETRYASERYEQLPHLAAELVKAKVEVIFAMAVPAIQAAKRETTTIPIVFETLGDAVSTGMVTNLSRPGGNVTGVSGFAPELSSKRLALLRDILPGATRIALMANRGNPATAVVIRTTEAAAEELRVHLLVIDVPRTDALDAAFTTMVRERCDAFVLAADPMLFSQRRRIVELAMRHRRPGCYEYRDFAEFGGLLSYGPDPHERFRRGAAYVDRILRGAQPGDLPVEQPRTFQLVLNLKTARGLGLTIPPSVRVRADHVIE
jgi:putative ABC transport system substrate-binding protein